MHMEPLGDVETQLAGNQSLGLFSSPAWLGALADSFPYDFFVIRHGEGAIPLARITDFIGPRIVSLPFSDYLEIGSDALDWEKIFVAIRGGVGELPVKFRWAGDFTHCKLERGVQGRVAAQYHRVAIQDQNSMFQNLAPGFRRNVRQALGHGIRIRRKTSDSAVDRFHHMFTAHRRAKFGVLSPPKSFFIRIARRFFKSGNGFVLEAVDGEQVTAAALVLRHGDGLYYKYGASLAQGLSRRPNNLLFWDLLCRAGQWDCRYVDLGMSWQGPDDAGLVRFKEDLGGVSSPISVLASSDLEASLRDREARSVLRDLTRLWVESDAGIPHIQKAGDRIFQYFT
ncbi:MAG: GNAT family N-acetyltransferase [Desulfobacterales bacterium]|nr:GNAT family N-acetyltransferase [Desulfobacterales bacterium]